AVRQMPAVGRHPPFGLDSWCHLVLFPTPRRMLAHVEIQARNAGDSHQNQNDAQDPHDSTVRDKRACRAHHPTASRSASSTSTPTSRETPGSCIVTPIN